MGTFASTAHWRDSARSPRFFIIDARAAFPILFFLMHIRIWTAVVVLITTIFFAILEHYGFSVPIFFRWLRSLIAGPVRSATPWWRQ